MERFNNVWDALADTPQEAASLKARSALMIALSELIVSRGWTQRQAAECLGVTQPRVSDLMRGKFNLFSLDALLDMAAVAGLEPRLTVRTRSSRGGRSSRMPTDGARRATKPVAARRSPKPR